MKKIVSSAVAAAMVLGSTAATAAPALERTTAELVSEEGLEGENGILIAVLAAAAVIAGIIIIENEEDEDDLPTSP